MKKTVALILLFFYIYPIYFNVIPISTRIIFSFVGVLFITCKIFCNSMTIPREYFALLGFLFLIFFLSCITLIINGTSDLEFVKYPASVIAILLGAHALIRIFSIMRVPSSFEFVAKLFVSVVIIQSIVAVLMYVFPQFYDFMTSIQRISTDEFDKMSLLSDTRIIGFGSQYFGAGITNGLALIVLAYLIRIGEYDGLICKASLSFLLIFIVGIAMARTTFIGFALGIIMLLPLHSIFKLSKKQIIRNCKLFFSIFLLSLMVLTAIYIIFPSVITSAEPLIDFALEIFLNYFKSGQFTTVSTSHLESMYIFPDNLYTYLIGDGLYTDTSGLYYMGTDVGYLRLIFYFGVFGVFLFLSIQYFLLNVSIKKIRQGKILFLLILLYVIVLNLKGFADLASVLALFFTLSISNKNRGDKCFCNVNNT